MSAKNRYIQKQFAEFAAYSTVVRHRVGLFPKIIRNLLENEVISTTSSTRISYQSFPLWVTHILEHFPQYFFFISSLFILKISWFSSFNFGGTNWKSFYEKYLIKQCLDFIFLFLTSFSFKLVRKLYPSLWSFMKSWRKIIVQQEIFFKCFPHQQSYVFKSVYENFV